MLAHPTRGRDHINMRVLPRVRELIDQAAEASGKTRSDFVLDAARRAAEAFLLDRRVSQAGSALTRVIRRGTCRNEAQ
jgi:uncharacterized protein (DUF1778 family)